MTIREDGPDVAPLVEFEGYQGPLDLLLELTRDGRIDIRTVQVDVVCAQFLAFLEARMAEIPIETASEWLLTAAILVQLKSRLLLPVRSRERRDAEAAADDLATRLERLAQARRLSQRLTEGLVLGRDWLRPGASTGERSVGGVDMSALVLAFAAMATSRPAAPVAVPVAIVRHVHDVVTVKDAVRCLRTALASLERAAFLSIVPRTARGASEVRRRSAVATAFVAVLGDAKAGRVEFDVEPETLRIESVRRQG